MNGAAVASAMIEWLMPFGRKSGVFLHGKAVVCACCFLVVRFVASGGMAMV